MNIKKARPKARTRTPRAVNRGIHERVALRSSIQTAFVRSCMALASIHSNQAEEILLQVFFLDHYLRRWNPGLDQQAGDGVRVFKRRDICEFQSTIAKHCSRMPGGSERQA